MKILQMMKDNPEITLDEIASKLELSKRAIEKQVQKLRESKKIERFGGDNGGKWIVKE